MPGVSRGGGQIVRIVLPTDEQKVTALKHGATLVRETVKKEDERGGFKEAGDTTWWLGTKVA